MDGVRSGGGGVVSLGLGSGPRHRARLGLLPGLAVGLLLQRLRDDVGKRVARPPSSANLLASVWETDKQY